MGFFDVDVENSMDEMFDFDRDGVLNPMERGLETEYMATGNFDWEENDGDGDEWEDEDEFDELEEAGIDRDDWDLMDDEERAEALEEAGLDPDDIDFY